jgi:hypothetical protein
MPAGTRPKVTIRITAFPPANGDNEDLRRSFSIARWSSDLRNEFFAPPTKGSAELPKCGPSRSAPRKT